jgi:hypothetical protein
MCCCRFLLAVVKALWKIDRWSGARGICFDCAQDRHIHGSIVKKERDSFVVLFMVVQLRW